MTREDILAITPEDTEGQSKLNQIIVQFMGLCWHEWKSENKTYFPEKKHDLLKYVGIPYREIRCAKCNERWKGKHVRNAPKNPDYCRDFNLMREVELKFAADARSDIHSHTSRYLRNLRVTTGFKNHSYLTFANAWDKAKAAAITILETKGA